MVGPSAMGSENGTPNSRMSAPPETMACIVGTQSARLGSPTEKKGISALRPARASRSNVAGIRDKSNSLERNAATFGNRGHILVAPTGKVDQQNLFLSHGRRHFHGLCQRMAGFKGWNDAFH